MRILFLGGGRLAERSFARLTTDYSSALPIVGTCSNEHPDEGWWNSAQIAQWSIEHAVPFVPNAHRNDAQILSLVRETSPDLLLSVQHPWVITPATLDAVGYRALNLHTAPLPDYAGFNGVSQAILDGCSDYGVDLHWMRPEVDTGPTAFAERFPIPPGSTGQSLHSLAFEAGLRVLDTLFVALTEGSELPNRDAPTRPVRFFGVDSLDGHREINDPTDLDEVDRKSRAFFFPPFEPAFVVTNGKRVPVLPDSQVT